MAPEENRAPDDGDQADHVQASNKRPRLGQAEGDSLVEVENPTGSEVQVPPDSSGQPAGKTSRPRQKYGKTVNEMDIEPAFLPRKKEASWIYQMKLDPEDLPPRRPHKKPRYAFKDGLSDDGPPMHDLREIFDNMAKRANRLGFRDVTNHLRNRALRVATMCSGSDAPIYGLNYFQAALKMLPAKYQFNFVHLFSVEIEPHIQSFITRNLGVMCFQDVREVAAYPDGGKPATAYGGVADVPGNLDLLLAGFACVDYSSLNRNPKKFNEVGQSGDTLRAILTYCALHRPKLVILENILRAPWKEVEDLIHCETTYSAAKCSVDTKDYYLPQTRNRGYLVMVEHEAAKGEENAKRMARRWAKTLENFKRPATSPVDDFIFKADDPRVQKAQVEMQSRARPRETDWNLSRGRHHRVRATLGLGQRRPITNWIEGGQCTVPDFGSRTWTQAQVHRVLDGIEINFLRSLWRGFDPFFKNRFWNLSQNVDRETDSSKFGLVGCLTPTAKFYVTSRGGPMTGAECLALQGLKVKNISVTRETEKELISLAGNAMSTTVVTVVVLNLLICAYQVLDAGEGSQRDEVDCDESGEEDTKKEADLEGDAKTRLSISMNHYHLQEPQSLSLETVDKRALLTALSLAPRSLRMCTCEGPDQISNQPINTCTKCGHTACRTCSGHPKHYYGASTSVERARPSQFREYIRKALPTRLYMGEFDLAFVYNKFFRKSWMQNSDDKEDWYFYLNALERGLNGEFRYQSVERAHDCWTIKYNGDSTRLELKIDAEQRMSWYLYLNPSGELEKTHRQHLLLRNHIAKMNPTDAEDPLSGVWEFRLAPKTSEFWLSITGSGSLVASWEAKQGLERAANDQVWDSLQVKIKDYETPILHGYDINGRYELLQECGTAYGSLYKRVQENSKEPPIFLFYDPEHYSLPQRDFFVFATTSHRRQYGEKRDFIASLEPRWWPTEKASEDVRCRARGGWTKVDGRLQDVSGLADRGAKLPLVDKPCASVASLDLNYAIWPSVSQFWQSAGRPLGECSQHYVAILLCKVPLLRPETYGWKKGAWQAFNASRDPGNNKVLIWLFEKVKTLLVPSEEWKAIQLPTDLVRCTNCTPPEPFIRWERRIKGKRRFIVPYEDPESASRYEVSMKKIVSPFLIQTKIGPPAATGYLRIGLNIVVLVHRALAKLTGGYRDRANELTLCVSWHLDPRYKPPIKPELVALTSKSNAEDPELPCDFPHGQSLRVEQRRSHHWMLQRDARPAPFIEQEIEEAFVQDFDCRAAVKVQRKCGCRGGALTDEVGFGKTVMILALIQTRKPYDDLHPLSTCEDHVINFKQHPKLSAHQHSALFNGRIRAHCNARIPLKATLIVGPPTLIQQWEEEIMRFLGKEYKVITIQGLNDLKLKTVRDYKAADIVLVSWEVLNSEHYLDRLSTFAGIVEGSLEGGRAFDSWLEVAYGKSLQNLGRLRRFTNFKAHAKFLQAELSKHENDPELFRRPESKKLSGKNYLKDAEERQKGLNNKGGVEWPARVHKIPDFGFDKAGSVDDIKGVTLNLFCWARCVTDEFPKATPLSISVVANLQAVSRWVLSATPPMNTFDDVKRIAYLLGVYLGIDDFSEHSMTMSEKKKFRTQRSAAEVFRAFNTAATPVWHEERQRHAQFFLDVFTRKNHSSYHYLRWVNALAIVEMAPIELAIQRELEQYIEGQEMKVIRASLSRAETDRHKRLAQVFEGCKEGEEALIHCATKFFHGLDHSEKLDLATIHNKVIGSREQDLIHSFRRIFLHFLIAEYLRARVKAFPLNKPEIYAELTLFIKRDTFGDRDAMRIVQSLREWAEENCRDFPIADLYKAIARDQPRLWTDSQRLPELRYIGGVLRRHIEDAVARWRACRYFQNARDLQQALHHLPLGSKLRFPSPIQLQVPSQITAPGGRSAVFDQDPNPGELQMSKAEFNRAFPLGYDILYTSGSGKWCAWYAVIESMKAQHPQLPYPTPGRLNDILSTCVHRLLEEHTFPSRFVTDRLFVGTVWEAMVQDLYVKSDLGDKILDIRSQYKQYTVFQVNLALNLWGQCHNLNLQLGFKVRIASVIL